MPQNVTHDEKHIKLPFASVSTLMKPTASQLAKQNRPREVKRASRSVHMSQKPAIQKTERSFEDPSENGNQAAKRQKLEGGHLKKNITPECYSQASKLRLTIPREPELETARRAHRLQVQSLRSDKYKRSQEDALQAQPMFKARPLNRKIFETPSLPITRKRTAQLPKFQVFDLKTDVRALQRSLGAPSSSSISKDTFTDVEAVQTAPKRLQCHAFCPSSFQKDDLKQYTCESVVHIFKAQPLDKKVLSSKGDLGVFRSTKREVTKPMEFNFSTKRRCKQDPPTELFDKLTLHSETQQALPVFKLQCPCGATQGSKENMTGRVLEGYKDVHPKCKEPKNHGIEQIDFANGISSSCVSRSNRFRSLGIR